MNLQSTNATGHTSPQAAPMSKNYHTCEFPATELRINIQMIYITGFTGWWFQPTWKILVQMFIFPNFRGENTKYFRNLDYMCPIYMLYYARGLIFSPDPSASLRAIGTWGPNTLSYRSEKVASWGVIKWNKLNLDFFNLSIPRKSKPTKLLADLVGSGILNPWIILKTILCLVLDSQGIETNDFLVIHKKFIF